jgi:hypothetical protein
MSHWTFKNEDTLDDTSSSSATSVSLHIVDRCHGQQGQRAKENTKHAAAGIPTWSPTVVLICRSTGCVWQSGRDAQFSADCGRMCLFLHLTTIDTPPIYVFVSLTVSSSSVKNIDKNIPP